MEEDKEEDTNNFINVVQGIGRDVSNLNTLRDVILNLHEIRSECYGLSPGS